MNLQTAKSVVSKMHELLDPCADIDFLVEPFFIAEYIKSDHARVQICEDDRVLIESPHVSISVTSDDSIDGPGGNSLLFTYHAGDDVAFGPKHALLISKYPEKQAVYWRKRGQNPANNWHYNALARGQIGFRFTPDVAEAEFMSRRAYHEFLQQPAENSSGTAAYFLEIDPSAMFWAETAYLQYWNSWYNNAPLNEGIEFNTEINHAENRVIIEIACDQRADIEPINITYDFHPENHKYDVAIMDGSNLVYQRLAEQDELTEWLINSMANDAMIGDGYGHALFNGEIINI